MVRFCLRPRMTTMCQLSFGRWVSQKIMRPRLVILVKLDEDSTTLQDTRKTNACKKRLRKLAVQFGNEAGKSEFGIIDSKHQPEDIKVDVITIQRYL